MIDLLETSELKEAIQAEPGKLQEIIDRASVGICVTNAQGLFVAVNKKYCEVYGYNRQELIGQPFTLIVPEELRERMDLLHQKFLRDKHEISRNWNVINRQGSTMEISVDTAYSDTILDQGPHKITFVHVESGPNLN